MAKRFFLCGKCGNIVGLISEGGGTLSCCGEPMQELVPNTTDAAQESMFRWLLLTAVAVK